MLSKRIIPCLDVDRGRVVKGVVARIKEQAIGLDLSKSLPQEERLLIEGRYRETIEDWPKAAEIYRSLWGLFPDNLDYGLRLAAA